MYYLLNLLYLLGFPLAVIFIRKYELPLKKKVIILMVGFCFSTVPFLNYKPEPKEIKIITEPSIEVVLGKNMSKKISFKFEPENANERLLEFCSDDYTVAYIKDGSICSLNEGITYVYAKYKGITSNKVKVIVDYSKYIDFTVDENVVYMTESGNKYHTYNCSTVNPTIRKTTLEEAENQGATPCKSCYEH